MKVDNEAGVDHEYQESSRRSEGAIKDVIK